VRLRTAIAAADGVLIATREYNGSIPGVLKNARDWGSRPFPDNAFRDKPVIVMDDSAGLFAAAWAKPDLRRVVGIIGENVIDQEMPIREAEQAFGINGRLIDPTSRPSSRS
jgi:chromate reductase